VLKILQ